MQPASAIAQVNAVKVRGLGEKVRLLNSRMGGDFHLLVTCANRHTLVSE